MSEISKRDLKEYKDTAIEACRDWQLDSTNIELICNGENVTYKLSTGQKNYAIRVTDENHRKEEQIIAELDWITYLSQNQISVAKPLELEKQVYHKKTSKGLKTYYTSIFEWANGKIFEKEFHLNKNTIKKIGSYLGRMNALTKNYETSHLIKKRKLWEDSRHVIKATNLIAKANSKLTSSWLEAKKWYDSLEKNHESYGLCHIDLHTGNFHITNENLITAFDFDDASYCFFTYDIVIPLMRLHSNQTSTFSYEKIEEYFLEGYLEENSLDQIWIERIPSFIRLRDIEMYAWVEFMFGENKSERQISHQAKTTEKMLKKHSYI